MKLPEERSEWVRWAVIAVVIGAGGWFISHQFESLDLEQILQDASDTLGQWTYLLAGLLAFLETGAFVGLVVPGETFVILAGAVAGQGATDIYITIAIVWFAAWAGDTTSFFVGRRLGRGFILRHGPKLRITEERFEQVEGYFERHGGKTILIGRFIGLVRALAPFVAGSSGMEYRAFVPYSILGTGLWAAAFSVIGYFGSQSIEEIANVAGQGVLLFGITVAVVVAIVMAVRFFREQENREKVVAWMERRALLQPVVALARRVKPQARFVWNRITPGGLGLELTALFAVVAVGVFLFVGYGSIVSGDPGPTVLDQEALDFVHHLESGWLTSLAKAVTNLGSTAAIIIVGILAAIGFGIRRRWPDVGVLVVSLVTLLIAVPAFKAGFGRPRPPDGILDVQSDAYPSGHAAYSVLYAWIALAATAHLRPSRVWASVFVVVGIAIAVLIGLSRVYLRVHFLSDVVGGWGLGAAVFATCAIVALVAPHLRNDSRR
jgi:undecaprenyl-diphosphatase